MILFQDICKLADTIQKSPDVRSIHKLKDAIDQAGFEPDDAQRILDMLSNGAKGLLPTNRSLPGMVTVAKSACEYLDIDYELDFKLCRKVAGSTIEAICLLMANMNHVNENHNKESLSFDDVVEIYSTLSLAKSSEHKIQVLKRVWVSLAPLEIRWFLNFFKSPMSILGIDPDYVSPELAESIPIQSIRLTIIHATRIGSSKQPRFMDFVLGVNVSDDDRFVQDYIPIGKINGRPDEEIATQLDALLADTITEKFGPTVAFEPQLVLDVTYKGIRKNPRTKAGFVLVEPEIRSILNDNILADVERLGDLLLARG